jgi:hypothetical protein
MSPSGRYVFSGTEPKVTTCGTMQWNCLSLLSTNNNPLGSFQHITLTVTALMKPSVRISLAVHIIRKHLPQMTSTRSNNHDVRLPPQTQVSFATNMRK